VQVRLGGKVGERNRADVREYLEHVIQEGGGMTQVSSRKS
jgi:hypothetical protein